MKDRVIKIIAILFVIAVLFLLFYSYGLAKKQIKGPKQLSKTSETQGKPPADEPDLQDSMFLQTLIDALNHPSRVEEIYDDFSSEEKADTSFELFAEYMDLLHTHNVGSVKGLSIFTRAEVEQYEKRLLPANRRSSKGVVYKYYHLDSANVADEDRLTLRLRSKDDVLSLDPSYMQDTLDMVQHANLYFAALREKNIDALSLLIYSDENDLDLKRLKAKETIAFYEEKGFNLKSKPQALDLNADYLIYRFATDELIARERINSSDSETDQENLLREKGHYLSFKRGREGIKIIDLIPMPELSQVRYVRWSEQSEDSEFATQRQIDVQKMKSLKKAMEFFTDPEQKVFILDYEPIPLQLVDSPETVDVYPRVVEQNDLKLVFIYPDPDLRNRDQHGQMVNMQLGHASKTWKLGGDLKLGMSRMELLKLYPFIDVYNYQVGLSSHLGLQLRFDNNNKIRQIEFLSPYWLTLKDALRTTIAVTVPMN